MKAAHSTSQKTIHFADFGIPDCCLGQMMPMRPVDSSSSRGRWGPTHLTGVLHALANLYPSPLQQPSYGFKRPRRSLDGTSPEDHCLEIRQSVRIGSDARSVWKVYGSPRPSALQHSRVGQVQ
ncbi:unnamed protein product, partial [Protopolystoma xenopodis]